MALPCIREDGLSGNPETAALMRRIWVTKKKNPQSSLGASKDMLGYDVGKALLLSLSFPDACRSCWLSPPLRFM